MPQVERRLGSQRKIQRTEEASSGGRRQGSSLGSWEPRTAFNQTASCCQRSEGTGAEFALCLEPSACRCLASSHSPPLSFKEAFCSLTKEETVAPKLASSPQSYSRYDGKLATAFH